MIDPSTLGAGTQRAASHATSHTSVILCVAGTRDAVTLTQKRSFMALLGAHAKAINTHALNGRKKRPIRPILAAYFAFWACVAILQGCVLDPG